MQRILAIFAYLAVAGCATPPPNTTPVLNTDDSIAVRVEADYWFRLGNEHAEAGRLEEAEYAYRQALQQGQGVKALHNLGLVQIRLGIAALREARRQLPETHPVHQETREFLRILLQQAL